MSFTIHNSSTEGAEKNHFSLVLYSQLLVEVSVAIEILFLPVRSVVSMYTVHIHHACCDLVLEKETYQVTDSYA
jgi:hypothetical protein